MDNTKKKLIGQRINTLLGEQEKMQKELAEYLKVKDNVISYFCSGTRTPNIEQIIEIADFFNVSTDYLLGRTDIKSTETKVQDICEYTGLSEKAVNQLKHIKSNVLSEFLLQLINFLIERNGMPNDLLYPMWEYLFAEIEIPILNPNQEWTDEFLESIWLCETSSVMTYRCKGQGADKGQVKMIHANSMKDLILPKIQQMLVGLRDEIENSPNKNNNT